MGTAFVSLAITRPDPGGLGRWDWGLLLGEPLVGFLGDTQIPDHVPVVRAPLTRGEAEELAVDGRVTVVVDDVALVDVAAAGDLMQLLHSRAFAFGAPVAPWSDVLAVHARPGASGRLLVAYSTGISPLVALA